VRDQVSLIKKHVQLYNATKIEQELQYQKKNYQHYTFFNIWKNLVQSHDFLLALPSLQVITNWLGLFPITSALTVLAVLLPKLFMGDSLYPFGLSLVQGNKFFILESE
jgi:hypothetical protein